MGGGALLVGGRGECTLRHGPPGEEAARARAARAAAGRPPHDGPRPRERAGSRRRRRRRRRHPRLRAPGPANAQVSSRTRISQPRVRLETCVFATVAGARGEPVPDDLLHPNPGSGASRDEPAPPRAASANRRRFRRVPGRTPWCGGAGGAPGAVQGGDMSESVAKVLRAGIGRR